MPPAPGHLWYWRILLKKSVRRIRQNFSGCWSAFRKNELRGPPRLTSIGRATSAVPSRCQSAAILDKKTLRNNFSCTPASWRGALATASRPARNNVGNCTKLHLYRRSDLILHLGRDRLRDLGKNQLRKIFLVVSVVGAPDCQERCLVSGARLVTIWKFDMRNHSEMWCLELLDGVRPLAQSRICGSHRFLDDCTVVTFFKESG